ncbi:hypothetical protein CLV98_104224 [Dyadobacter jejuensis]|uniref:Uncharacterized protein n=1 Tax=Dyadobacter jejuensis TaxID=1082580 RepID=A0A316AKQ1_9BACT|nr:hypothetical protein [Dyadobacter jejuensis]PWJ58365.1 hypothetical protein CLV98_104224 [Dyadobacter jejuensis]
MRTYEGDKPELARSIRLLWDQQCIRESLYLKALRKDRIGALRRVLSQGYFSAMLFKRELKTIYDYAKCFMSDTDLDLVCKEQGDQAQIIILTDLEEERHIAGFFRGLEESVLESYQGLFHHFDWDTHTRQLLLEHKDRIRDFINTMAHCESPIQMRSVAH